MKPDVIELRRLYGGFQASRAVITANNLRVFDRLKGLPRTALETARAMRTDPRATEILLDALTGLGLLRKTGKRYRNAPLAARFMVKGAPEYQGDIISHIDNLWDNWSGLDEVVRTGRPSRKSFDHRSFIMGMHNLSRLRVRKVLSAIGLRGVGTALDLGGGPGTYAIEMSKRGVKATVLDTPDTVKIARKVARDEGAKSIGFIKGDFHVDGIGRGYDLVFVSHILHAYSEEDNIALLRKCRDSLNPRGRVAVQEFMLSENRTSPPHGALFSINMLVGTEGGRTYTPREISGWLRKAGLSDIKSKLVDGNVILIGKKRGS